MDVRLFHVCDLSGGDFAQKNILVTYFSSFASREPGYFAIHNLFLVRFRRIGCSCVTQQWCCILSSFSISGTRLLRDTSLFLED